MKDLTILAGKKRKKAGPTRKGGKVQGFKSKADFQTKGKTSRKGKTDFSSTDRERRGISRKKRGGGRKGAGGGSRTTRMEEGHINSVTNIKND